MYVYYCRTYEKAVSGGGRRPQTLEGVTRLHVPKGPAGYRLGLRSGFDPPDLDRPGRLPNQQGLCEARLGYRDGSPQLGAPGPESVK